ncbi:unnamed protein product [Cladocopium goreaui]|uniref:132 kDa protein n=1 Tax=Cladocopium goreaui TaxID=2562237 RepID=A0A9P1D014_9DINO|nr:unnamed protein product [Cladocopium goreaui]
MAPSPGVLLSVVGLLLMGRGWTDNEAAWAPRAPAPTSPTWAWGVHRQSLPAPIGRRTRRRLTTALNTMWAGRVLGSPAWKRPLRRTWGYRGVRVGEARHPGPSAPGSPLHPAIQRCRAHSPDSGGDRHPLRRRVAEPGVAVRCFCPVPGCGHGDAMRAAGWASHEGMRHHLDDHCSGTLTGAVPAEYLQAHRLDLCSVCGLLVGRRYNGPRPPSFSTIMGHTAPTLRHVPHVARAAWAQCLARAVAAAATTNTGPAWQELLMLPKAVLAAPLRGGGGHHKQAALSTLRRCQRWLAGERMELWDELVQPRPARARADGVELAAQHTRCCALAAEGELSRACAALTEPPPLPPSRATLEALAAQHPQAAPPDVAQLGPARPAAVPEVTKENVVRAVRSFSRASAPGPSGLRADHLQETLSTAHGDEVASHLVALCQLLARGEPALVAPHLAGARLHALPKKQGGVRPIAVGETLRRLVSKALCQAVREDAVNHFCPLQVGVGARMGAAFDLLGAPIGDSEYCTQATLSDKVQKAGKVLDALGELDNPQVSLQLLRHCASFTKLVHNMRTTPAGLHSAALAAFDGKARACLESIGCFPVPDRIWQQATLGVKHGGLGLRQCAVHATAAYLASVATTQEACRGLDGRYNPDWPTSSATAATYNAVVLEADRFRGDQAHRQQALSAALDKAQLAQLLVTAEDASGRAHLQLLQQPAAGAWLLARPSPALGLDLVEKMGLLPERPEELGASEVGRPSVSQRRPADVYLPNWGAYGPAAMDLAATSGMRGSVLATSAGDGASAAANYEIRKKIHHNTAQLCAGQGLQFIPLVVEACGGGWGPTAVATFRKLGALHASRLGMSASDGAEQLFQALSVALQRENARAVLRRLAESSDSVPSLAEP